MKKKLAILIVFVLIFLLIMGGILWRRAKKDKEEGNGGRPTPGVVSVFEKYGEPKVKIKIFSSKTKGRLLITDIPEFFKKIEYDVLYQTMYDGNLLEKGVGSGQPLNVPPNRTLERELVFGTESCTPQQCNFHADKLELNYPLTVVLKLYDEGERVWELEKKIEVEKMEGVYVGEG